MHTTSLLLNLGNHFINKSYNEIALVFTHVLAVNTGLLNFTQHGRPGRGQKQASCATQLTNMGGPGNKATIDPCVEFYMLLW